MRYRSGPCFLLVFVFGMMLGLQLHAVPTFGVLTNFNSATNGAQPGGLIQARDGNFYGFTMAGGASGQGAFYKMTPAGVRTLLVSFGGSGGSQPTGNLAVGSDGNFYGTTTTGGASGLGTVFRVTSTGILSCLASFNGANGSAPEGGLILASDGDFYGTTSAGGANSQGTVFKVTPSGVISVMVSFAGANGSSPVGGLVQGTDGNFYGTTSTGGLNGDGTIFQMTPAGVLTTLVSFDGSDGLDPQSAMVQGPDGNFYGTTVGGGTYYEPAGATGAGTIFKVTPAGAFTMVYDFDAPRSIQPNGLTLGKDGSFYGTTYGGGNETGDPEIFPTGLGTIFKLTSQAGSFAFATLYSFSGPDGAAPGASLVQGTDGDLYGTTTTESADPDSEQYEFGNVFKITPTGTLTSLTTFEGVAEGEPGCLTQGSDGSLYGVAAEGGASNYGGIFKLNSSGIVSDLASFTGPTGFASTWPTDLIQGSDGNFYGTTTCGGNAFDPTAPYYGPYSGLGTIFRFTPGGSLSTVHFFQGGTDGQRPCAGVTEGPNGSFYGTTYGGGQWADGSAFKVTPAGTLTTLFSFNGNDYSYNPPGVLPLAPLLLGKDGNFYGSTSSSSPITYPAGGGTIFKITPAGVLTVVTSFYKYLLESPVGRLIQGGDGSFYGVTYGAGFPGGRVFKLSPAGALTTICPLQQESEGLGDMATLILNNDGSLYGTVGNSFTSSGKFFEVSSTGTVTTYNVSNGFSNGQLIKGTDGNLYGTAARGGTSNEGLIFEFALTPPRPQTIGFPGIANQPLIGQPVALAAAASSGLPVSYTVTGPAMFETGPASVPGERLAITGAGTVTVTASQGGNFNYVAASDVVRSFTVGKGAQTITFPAMANEAFNGPAITLQATASSGLGVTYSVAGPATLSGNVLTLTGVGTVAVTASQAGNAFYTAAVSVTVKLTALKSGQAITFPAIVNSVAGGSYTLGATASSGLPVTYTVAGPGTLAGNVLTLSSSGTVSVTARQAGNTNYTAAPNVERVFTAMKAGQTITFPAIANEAFHGPAIRLNATASSGVSVSYAVAGPATLSGLYLTLTGTGTVAVTASQSGNSFYAAANPVQQKFTSLKAGQTITFPAIGAQSVGAVVNLGATASSGLAVTYKVAGPATVAGTRLTVTGKGTVAVAAYQAGNGNYSVAEEVRQTFAAR